MVSAYRRAEGVEKNLAYFFLRTLIVLWDAGDSLFQRVLDDELLRLGLPGGTRHVVLSLLSDALEDVSIYAESCILTGHNRPELSDITRAT